MAKAKKKAKSKSEPSLQGSKPERTAAKAVKAGKSARKKAEKVVRAVKATRLRKTAQARERLADEPAAEVLSSSVAYQGPLFKVLKEEIREPNGCVTNRDIIRHNGSVVILPIDSRSSKKDPLVILERQYRHAAGQYLWEIPAGKIEEGEERLAGARRELLEETGYTAGKWTELVRYFASPGFLGEWMQVYLAEELTPGTAAPEEDETLEIYSFPLSEVEAMIDRGSIQDGKTLIGISMYKRLLAGAKSSRKKRRSK